MSRVTSKAKKQPSFRVPLNYSSVSEVVLNFLYMFSRTNVYGPTTLEYLFKINSDKYKTVDALRRSLERLQKMGYVEVRFQNKLKTYHITQKGKTVPTTMAMGRKLNRDNIEFLEEND